MTILVAGVGVQNGTFLTSHTPPRFIILSLKTRLNS